MYTKFQPKNLKRPLRRPKSGLDDNIKTYLKEVECEDDWIHLAQDRDHRRALMKMVMNLRAP